MDALSEVLRVCRLGGGAVLNADFGAPWSVAIGATGVLARTFLPDAESPAIFHLVIAGECLIHAAGSAPVRLGPGDAALVIRGSAHRLANSSHAPEAAFPPLPKAPPPGGAIPIRHRGNCARPWPLSRHPS